MDIKIHMFEAEAAERVYDTTQTGYFDEEGNEIELKDGDVFVVASRGIIGFLCGAWPIAILYREDDLAGLHTIGDENDLAREYAASIAKCKEIGEADADITGNDHWRA